MAYNNLAIRQFACNLADRDTKGSFRDHERDASLTNATRTQAR